MMGLFDRLFGTGKPHDDSRTTDAKVDELYDQVVNQAMGFRARIQEHLLAWINTPDWQASQDYLTSHPELVTGYPEQILASMLEQTESAGESRAAGVLRQHMTLLQAAREQGIPTAYARLITTDDPSHG